MWKNFSMLLIPDEYRADYINNGKPVTLKVPLKYKYLSPEFLLTDPNGVIHKQFVNPKTRIVQDNQAWVNIETYSMNNLFK